MILTERERVYVEAVFAAYRVCEEELRGAKRILKEPIENNAIKYMEARSAAHLRQDQAEIEAWGKFCLAGRTTAHRLRPTASPEER
jgi:hypothetical protein